MRIPSMITKSALAATLALTGVTAGVGVAHAQSWGRNMERCAGDRCATFHCDWDGDNCVRTGSWHYRYGGYYTRREYSYRTMTRCDSDGDRCATFRCDADGDRCVRTSGWWYR